MIEAQDFDVFAPRVLSPLPAGQPIGCWGELRVICAGFDSATPVDAGGEQGSDGGSYGRSNFPKYSLVWECLGGRAHASARNGAPRGVALVNPFLRTRGGGGGMPQCR